MLETYLVSFGVAVIIGIDVQYVIGAFGLFAHHKIAAQVDPPVGDFCLHGDAVFTPFAFNGRSNIMKFNIFFGHLPLRLYRTHLITPPAILSIVNI